MLNKETLDMYLVMSASGGFKDVNAIRRYKNLKENLKRKENESKKKLCLTMNQVSRN